jgi:hypothetical protein
VSAKWLKPKEDKGESKHSGKIKGAFLVTRGNAAKLLETIEETFDAVTQTVKGRVNGTGMAMDRTVGNRGANVEAATKGANLGRVVAFVGNNMSRTSFRATALGTLNLSLLKEGFKEAGVMALSSSQDEGEGFAIALRPQMDFGRKATATTP